MTTINNFSEKRKSIIKDSKKAIKNYSEVKGGIHKIRGDLDIVEDKIDENIINLQKSVRLFETLPEEQISEPSPILVSMMGSVSQSAESVSIHSERLKDTFQRFTTETDLLMGTTAVIISTTSTMSAISMESAKVIAPQYPQIQNVIDTLKVPTPLEKRKNMEFKLRQVDPGLSEMFDGMWRTLKDKSKKDRYRQAAHSMKEIISQFLQILSPDEKVKSTDWYVQDPNRSRPTQRQRVRYAIVGERSRNTLDDKDLRPINELMDNARSMYEDLNKIAHARKKETEELFPLLESYIGTCQDILLNILELREKFYCKSI